MYQYKYKSNGAGNKISSSTSKDKPPQCSQLGMLESCQLMLEQFPSRSPVCSENMYSDEQKKPTRKIEGNINNESQNTSMKATQISESKINPLRPVTEKLEGLQNAILWLTRC
jgi:hypothetical protein